MESLLHLRRCGNRRGQAGTPMASGRSPGASAAAVGTIRPRYRIPPLCRCCRLGPIRGGIWYHRLCLIP